MAAAVIGDVSQLHQNRIAFNAVRSITGSSVHGHFALSSAAGFAHLASARASVRIVSDTLRCQIIGPAAADKAVSAYVAVIPSTAPAFPTTAQHILTIGGSAFVQHSLYVGAKTEPLSFSQEVAHTIKPTPLVGSPPEVVFFVEVTGGANTDVSTLRISGHLEVDGIGYVQPW